MRWSLTRGSFYRNLTRKLLVVWKRGRKQEGSLSRGGRKGRFDCISWPAKCKRAQQKNSGRIVCRALICRKIVCSRRSAWRSVIVNGATVVEEWKDEGGLGWVAWWTRTLLDPTQTSLGFFSPSATSLHFTLWKPGTGWQDEHWQDFKSVACWWPHGNSGRRQSILSRNFQCMPESVAYLPDTDCLPGALGLFKLLAISSLKIRISNVISSLFWHLDIWVMYVSWCALPTLSTTACATPVMLFWQWSSSATSRTTSKLELVSTSDASSMDL